MILSEIQSHRAKIAATVALPLLGVVLGLYLSGYFLLWRLHLKPLTASPLTIIEYWVFYSDIPQLRHWMLICAAAGFFLSLGLVAVVFMPARRKLHGDARFAKHSEVKKSGLLGEDGLVIGKWGGQYLMLPGQLGAMCAAPPRSGKGAGLVQPNMLNWPDSVVLLDIRQESYRLTSGYRAQSSSVFLFNPVAEDGMTMQWNPLDYVSDDPAVRVNDIQKIANMLSPDPAEGDPFWPAACRTLFLGLTLYVFETPRLPRTLGEVVRQIMSGQGETVGERWKKIIEDRDAAGKPLSHECKAALFDFIFTSGNTQSSIRKTFTAKLELWLNPLVDAATRTSSVDLRNLRRQRISIYVGIRPADLNRLSLILNLFYQQIIDLNTDLMPEDDPSLKYKLLLMMDEFTALGRMRIFEQAISFLGGYNIIPFIIVQGMSQLRGVYGEQVAETMCVCCAANIVYSPKENKHAQEISETIGYFTMQSRSKSKQAGFNRAGGSINTSDQKRALLMPQEVKQIGKQRELIFLENVRPILAGKISYWKVRVFKRRQMPAYEFDPIEIDMLPPSVTTTLTEQSPKTEQTRKNAKKSDAKITPLVRDFSSEDVGRMESLSLTDFDADFSEIDIPTSEPISDEDMEKAFASFVKTIEDSHR